MKVAIPQVYLGTMTFAWSSQTSKIVDDSIALEMVNRFVSSNLQMGINSHLVDTARVYAGGNTESMVGRAISGAKVESGKIVVGTKAHPSVPPGLSPQGLREQLETSLDEMQIPNVCEYYLHQPDTENSLLESLKCAHELVKEGTIEKIGMSNYHAKEVERAFELCHEHGLTPPTVYQGLYNPLNRLIEEELLPLLKENDCSFVAYNPLAAGLLSGKHKGPNEFVAGRFLNNQNYIPRFYTDANFKAVELVRKQCEKEGISMVEATYRWILRHSALDGKDGLLIGASSLDQLDENLLACRAACESDDLSTELLGVFDECWKMTAPGAFPYWRSYSSDMPDRESLDQGASYSAAKTK